MNGFTLYPKVSKVQTIGMGKSATHMSPMMSIFKTKLDQSNNRVFKFGQSIEHPLVNREFRKRFSYFAKVWFLFLDKLQLWR